MAPAFIPLPEAGTHTDTTPVPAESAWIGHLGNRFTKTSRRGMPLDVAVFAAAAGLLATWFASDDPRVESATMAASFLLMVLFMARVFLNLWWRLGYFKALQHCKEATTEAATQRTQDTHARASRRMAFKLPRQPRGEGYLYVIEFSTGTVKVGQTEDPQRRLAQHRSEAAAFGVYVANYWISPAHMNFRDNETRLINRCARVSHRSRKEYFHAVTYKTARQFTRELTYYSNDTTQTSVEGVWA